MQPTSYIKTFQITRNGIPIDQHTVINTVVTGIEYDTIPGFLPTFLVVKVAHASNYRYFDDWQTLSPTQQAFLIAHYIANTYVEQHKSDAEARELKKKT